MNKTNKLSILTSSALILGLTSCSSSSNNKSNSNQDNSSNYITTRTISHQNETYFIDNKNKSEALGKYDYNSGVASYPPIGEIKPKEDPSNTNEPTNSTALYTEEEVIQLTNSLSDEYNKYLENNINEYEKYISDLTDDYNILANEYANVLNSFDEFLTKNDNNSPNKNVEILPENSKIPESPPKNIEDDLKNMDNPSEDKTNNIDNPLKNQNTKVDNPLKNKTNKNENTNRTFNTREEEIDSAYKQALEDASKNLDEFENVQGEPQTIKDKAKNSPHDSNLNAEVIFKEILENVSLPKHNVKDITYLENNYQISKSNVDNFKLINFESANENFFEMLIIKTKGMSDTQLLEKIQFRLEGILKYISENNNEEIDLSDKIILVNIDDYTLFCLSNINEALMNFLTNK